MKKTLERLKRLAAPSAHLVALLLATLAAGGAWAETESALYVNVSGTSVTIANYGSSSRLDQSGPTVNNPKICIASGLNPALVASGMRVRVDNFEFVRDYNGTTAAPSKIRIVVDGVTHTSNTRTETSLNLYHQETTSKPISYGCKYVFQSTPYLKVGESYNVSFLDSSGNAQTSIRYEVVNNSAELITGISASGWRPAYTMSGTIITTVSKATSDTITAADAGSLIVVNGGTVNVSGSATATGLIVSSNTTLHFEEGATLTLSGPLYVESGNTLTISSADTITGSQTFITAGDVCMSSGAIASANASYSAAVAPTTIALTSYSNTASVSGEVNWSSIGWTDGTWHANSPVTLTLTGDATINLDNTYSMASLTLTGAHAATLVYTKTPTISSGAISCENSATYKIKIPATSTDWPLGSAWTVPNDGATYILAGSADSGTLTSCSGLITVNGKLETTGYLNLSAANKIATTGELEVLNGRTKMKVGGNASGICGTLTIDSGATFENVTDDGLNYGGTPTVNVYGTLDMASTRWTLGGSTLNFYAGSTITGAGDTYGNGALDSNSAKTFNILANLGQDTVNLSAKLRLRDLQTFDVASGVTVNCTGSDSGQYTNPLSITGSGKFKIATGASFSNGVKLNVISPSTLELNGGTIAGAIQGTGNLSVSSGTYEPSFSSFSGAVSVSGSGTVLTLTSDQVTAVSGITVGTGSTLKIKVTEDVINHGFDASSKVSNGGGTVMFVDSSGTEITENVSGDGETLSAAAKIWGDSASGTWDTAANWTVGVAPSDGDTVLLETADATITISTSSAAGAVSVNESTTIAGTAEALQSFATKVTSITIASGKTLTLSCTDDGAYEFNRSIGGAGALAVSHGTVTFKQANTFTGGLTVKQGGTLVKGDGVNRFGPDGRSITVEVGGTLDLNKTSVSGTGVSYAITIVEGDSSVWETTPVLTNSGDSLGTGWKQTSSITVMANATIECNSDHNWGLLASSYGTTSLKIGKGKTLRKVGGGEFWLTNVTLSNLDGDSGSGDAVLKIVAGSANVINQGLSYSNSLSSGALFKVEVVGGSLEVNKDFTISALSHQGGSVNIAADKTLNVMAASGVSISNGATMTVNNGGKVNVDNPDSRCIIAGSLALAGLFESQGDVMIDSTGSIEVTESGALRVIYDIMYSASGNSGSVTIPNFNCLNWSAYNDKTVVKNTASGKVVLKPTDSSVTSDSIGIFTDYVAIGSGSVEVDVTSPNLTLPTSNDPLTLFSTSTDLSTYISAGTISVTGNANYYLKQTDSAVTLHLYAAKDSAGVYYDNVADAFDAIVADHTLSVTILDGTEADYSATLASMGLGRNGTQVFHLVAERLDLTGATLAQYPTAQAAIEADSGDSIVAIHETSTVTAYVSPIYIKPVGISLDDITIKCAYAGLSYVKPDGDMSAMGLVGVYMIARDAYPATFTWTPTVEGCKWSDKDNWTSEDGEVNFAPNNANYTIVFESDATIDINDMPNISAAKIEVDAQVTLNADSGKSLEITVGTAGVVLASSSASITAKYHASFADDNMVKTTVAGKYVRVHWSGDWKIYDLVDSAATVYDAEDNVVNGYNSLADAIAAASDGQKVKLFANSSDNVTLSGKSITLIEDSYTFSGTFTGNGTLVLAEGTLLKSASSDRWAEGWTGTVWLRNYTDLTGKSIQSGTTYGSTSFEPNDYGNINSTVKFTGVKGYFTAHNAESYTIQPALELEDDGETPGLLLYNGWGYNESVQCYTIIRELKGSGTLKADPTIVNNSIPGLNVLLQVRKWDNFTGTLNMPNKNVAFGSTLPVQAEVAGGGHISIQSGESVEVPAGKTWTVGNGVVVYGNLSLGTGAAIVNTTAANTWIKRGTGTITLNALNDLPATPASTWQGTIVLPTVSDVGDDGFDFSIYGVDGSTIEIANGFTGWLKRTEAALQPAANFKITSAFTITGTSAEIYVLNKLSGTGNFTIDDIRNATSFTISELEDYSGTIVNTQGNSSKKITITKLNLASAPVAGQLLLKTTTPSYVTISGVYVSDVEQAVNFVNGDDGIYAGYATTTTGTGSSAVTTVETDGEVSSVAITLDSDYSGKVVIPSNVTTLNVTGATLTDSQLQLKVSYSGMSRIYENILTLDGSGNVSLDGSGSIDGVSVRPTVGAAVTIDETTKPPMDASAGGAPKFAFVTIPGLWYGVLSSTDNSTFTIEDSTIKQATSSATQLDAALAPTSGAKYYRIAVGASRASLTATP